MSTREALAEVIDSLPEDRMEQLLDFARFVLEQEDREAWRRFGQQQLARAYGEDEPEYSEADIKSEL
jgi:hypothetical protein